MRDLKIKGCSCDEHMEWNEIHLEERCLRAAEGEIRGMHHTPGRLFEREDETGVGEWRGSWGCAAEGFVDEVPVDNVCLGRGV